MLTSAGSAPLLKRKRLSYACNYCRAKKTRCDEQTPSCRNCQLAGVRCVTVDKRRPHIPIQHRRKDLNGTEQQPVGSPDDPPEADTSRVTALASPETTATSHSPSFVAPGCPPACSQRSGSPDVVSGGSTEWSNWDTRHLPIIPSRGGSNSVQITTQWLDLALSRLHISRSNHVRAVLRPCLSNTGTVCAYPIASGEPALPPVHELHRMTELFLSVYQPIYPFLDPREVSVMTENAPGRPQGCKSALADCKVARRMLLCLITILGTMASPIESQQHLSIYLGFCHTLVGHVILQPSLESVQALLLFSITLRVRDQLSPAWDMLMIAISMAQTLGLGDPDALRHSIPEREADSSMASRRTWWMLYVFEKFLAFDSGRRSTLGNQSLSSLERDAPAKPLECGQATKPQGYECYLTSLANVLHEMQDRPWRTWKREYLDARSDLDSRESKIRATGAIESLLWKWRSSLPPEYQIFVLYRNALLLDWSEVKREVDRFGSKEPWHLRIRNGPQICLEAAKDMTNLQVAVTESAAPSFLAVATSPLPAAYVLLIYIRCQPASILNRAHFEVRLLDNGSGFHHNK
ncbi:hypothetical protein AnigIFM62618_002749 [Aspergillus niger]|nr:hypothetical protein AnigIFM62618_002749 [Aspergillus niger]